jgi:hypothetical protein
MTDKYIVRSGATTNTLLKGQLRMKVNFSLVLLGAVVASAIALPAQAFNLVPQQVNSSNTTDIAYTGITDLTVNGANYNVSFNFGSFFGLYGAGGQPPTTAYTDPLAPYPDNPLTVEFGDALGAAIVNALPNGAKILAANILNGGSNVQTEFYIPKSLAAQNPNQDTFIHCFTTGDTCPQENISVGNNPNNVYFAQYSAATTTPPGTGTTPVPTPALIPGLLGMGLAAMRKKQQAA